MHLYNLTLCSSATSATAAIHGNFTGQGSGQSEIVIASNHAISLYETNAETGKMKMIATQPVFAIVRSIVPFRLPGTSKDYIFITSDAGNITVLSYNPQKQILEKVIQETFGKTGARRIVPAQYLVADPKGRAVMIASVEKSKLVYILNRDSSAKLTINSPLEANKSSTLCYHVAALDVGYENPIFAAIEIDYTDSDQDPTGAAHDSIEKVLTYYELDLGLNHVVRKWSSAIDRTSNFLLALPGGTDGPSGVLVCSEDIITWVHQGYESVSIPIPRRQGTDTGPVIIVSAVVHKLKKTFFALLQTELGDVFKVTMDFAPPNPDGTGANGVEALKIKYFDTFPVSRSLCLLKTGFLFAASEFGNHYFYQIENLGDDDEDQIEYNSAESNKKDLAHAHFTPRALRNLSPVDELSSLSPLTDAKVANLAGEETPQIYALCGKGARSSFRVLRHGIEVNEMAVSELPGSPSAVWTVKTSAKDEFDSYIVVSFVNATLVLSIGESVEEVTDSGFLGTTPTLTVAQIGEDSLVQVYTQGIRHIRSDKRVSEWKAPGGRIVLKAACNQKQVIIALSSGELVYFELDSMGNLNEYPERKEMTSPVTALALGPVPEGKMRSKFLAVGCEDCTVRLFSLDPTSCLQPIGLQALQSIPESITLTFMFDTLESGIKSQETLFLHIGLNTGVLLRCNVDAVTGGVSDMRTRFIGAKAITLAKLKLGAMANGEQGASVEEKDVTGSGNAVLVLSSRPWIGFVWKGRYKMFPLSYERLEHGASFTSPQCPEGIVAITGNTLRILTVEKLDSVFNEGVVPLSYTPRKMLMHPDYKKFVIIESDCRVAKKSADDMDEDDLPAEQFGLPRPADAEGRWASCIRLLDPFKGETLSLFELEDNEAAVCINSVQFDFSPGVSYVLVGTSKGAIVNPRSAKGGALRLYRYTPDGEKLELVHVTEMDDIPQAVCCYQNVILVGVGKSIRVYIPGKKKFLRKYETKFSNLITSIQVYGSRIVVTDVQDGIFVCQYYEHQIIPLVDDCIPRWVTSYVLLDEDTFCAGDKFGNLFIVRIKKQASEEFDQDPAGNKFAFERGFLNACVNKFEHICQYFVGETVTSLHKLSLIPGGREVIVYTTFLGTVGILIPFASKDDADFFTTLEMHIRQELPSILGRDHISYRSQYVPVRKVVDGDFVEQFQTLPPEKKRFIAEELDRSVAEVMKKLEDVRNRVAF